MGANETLDTIENVLLTTKGGQLVLLFVAYFFSTTAVQVSNVLVGILVMGLLSWGIAYIHGKRTVYREYSQS